MTEEEMVERVALTIHEWFSGKDSWAHLQKWHKDDLCRMARTAIAAYKSALAEEGIIIQG